MIDFNEGHIVQMSLSNKIMLRGKLDEALTNRKKLHESNNIGIDHIKVKQHLSEADIDVYD